jgi:hypothetical protein
MRQLSLGCAMPCLPQAPLPRFRKGTVTPGAPLGSAYVWAQGRLPITAGILPHCGADAEHLSLELLVAHAGMNSEHSWIVPIWGFASCAS